MNSNDFSPTQRAMLRVLEDGQPHSADELHGCLPDELGPKKNIRPHLTSIRKKIHSKSLEIICEWCNFRFCYRLVRVLRLGDSSELEKQLESLKKENLQLKWQLSEIRNKGRPISKSEEYGRLCIEFRKNVLARDKSICQDCGQVGGELEIHHILLRKWHPNLEFALNNCVTLCRKCHCKRHSGPNHFRRKDFNPNLPT